MDAPSPNGEITALLREWTEGNQGALEKLTPLVYHELRRLARRYLNGERDDISLQTTALIHEAYLRLVGYKPEKFDSRAHFFALSAQVMRRILVDHARRHNLKRGVGIQHIPVEDTVLTSRPSDADFVALDDALEALARLDARKARVVELRFFGGLSVEETAEVLDVSAITVMRDWNMARAWLYREMSGDSRS